MDPILLLVLLLLLNVHLLLLFHLLHLPLQALDFRAFTGSFCFDQLLAESNLLLVALHQGLLAIAV